MVISFLKILLSYLKETVFVGVVGLNSSVDIVCIYNGFLSHPLNQTDAMKCLRAPIFYLTS